MKHWSDRSKQKKAINKCRWLQVNMSMTGSREGEKRGGEMEGRIKKHTLSCGQDFEKETYTHFLRLSS